MKEDRTYHISRTTRLIVGALLGSLLFVLLFGTLILHPTNIGWLMEGDSAQHLLGWLFFRSEKWHFPLGRIDRLLHPVGANIGFTDSLPLVALALKPLSHLLPSDFQYIGPWLLICYALQGASAMLLLSLASEHLSVQLLGTVFFILSPVLVWRTEHDTLCAQWLVLLSLWACLDHRYRQNFSIWLSLVLLSALIHPYLTVMVLGLAAAALMSQTVLSIRQSVLRFCCLICHVFLVWFAIGYLSLGNYSSYAGTSNYFTMNLLSPFNPHNYSRFLPSLPLAYYGQYEGFSYLGLGMFLLLLIAVFRALATPSTVLRLVRANWPIALVMVAFFLLALGPSWTFGSHVLAETKNTYLLKMFAPWQSCGRFFWPVYYLLFFLAIRSAARFPARTATAVVLICLVLQVADLSGALVQKVQNRHPAFRLESKQWSCLPKTVKHIVLVPPSTCGEPAAKFVRLGYLAAAHGLSINDGYLARLDQQKIADYCAELTKLIHHYHYADDELYVIRPDHSFIFQNLAKPSMTCHKMDGLEVCTTTKTSRQWEKACSR